MVPGLLLPSSSSGGLSRLRRRTTSGEGLLEMRSIFFCLRAFFGFFTITYSSFSFPCLSVLRSRSPLSVLEANIFESFGFLCLRVSQTRSSAAGGSVLVHAAPSCLCTCRGDLHHDPQLQEPGGHGTLPLGQPVPSWHFHGGRASHRTDPPEMARARHDPHTLPGALASAAVQHARLPGDRSQCCGTATPDSSGSSMCAGLGHSCKLPEVSSNGSKSCDHPCLRLLCYAICWKPPGPHSSGWRPPRVATGTEAGGVCVHAAHARPLPSPQSLPGKHVAPEVALEVHSAATQETHLCLTPQVAWQTP